ncbi:MAG: DoxX family protein, partial [Bacteroidaceae bacterium]|nr:DoxX family protein [Bacteroidaceae bacterium]
METKAKVNDLPAKVLVNFCRIILGAVFMFSGIVKAIDPVGTQIKLSDYLYAFEMGGSVLDSTLLIVACILAGFEILIGAYLVIGAFCKGTSLIVLVLMFLLTGFTLFLAITNLVEDCGCFGDAIVLTNWQTFYKNVFLFLLSIYVFWRRSSIIPFVGAKRQWLVFLILIIVILKFISSNIRELPVLDFRPYKVGTD